MLALALLLGLIVWVLITLAAIFIGTKLGKSLYPDNPKAGLYGALSGFMLTMGGFIVYRAVEYVYIQTKVSHLCESEGGVTEASYANFSKGNDIDNVIKAISGTVSVGCAQRT